MGISLFRLACGGLAIEADASLRRLPHFLESRLRNSQDDRQLAVFQGPQLPAFGIAWMSNAKSLRRPAGSLHPILQFTPVEPDCSSALFGRGPIIKSRRDAMARLGWRLAPAASQLRAVRVPI